MRITIGAVVRGGTSVGYKTGSWRDARPAIDYQACTACGICWEVCPDSSITFQAERYVVDFDYCKGCGLCAYECPSRCIRMLPEER